MVISGVMPILITAQGNALYKFRKREENPTNRYAARERGVISFAKENAP